MGDLTSNHCTIMFADIAGSTRLYNQLGDEKAEFLISTRLAIMCNITFKYNGRVIKKIGDEIMCRFISAEDAALAATEMHIKKVTSDNAEPLVSASACTLETPSKKTTTSLVMQSTSLRA